LPQSVVLNAVLLSKDAREKGAMSRLLRCAIVFVAMPMALPAARAGEPVDLLLVLAADVSRSIDATKFQLQREGYAAAVADPHVPGAQGPRRCPLPSRSGCRSSRS